MIFSFPSYPLVRLVLCFALGIVGYHYLGDVVLLPVAFLVLAFLTFFSLALKSSLKFSVFNALLVFLVLFGLGNWRLKLYKNVEQASHLLNNDLDKVKAYKAQILEQPKRKSRTFNVVLRVYETYDGVEWKRAAGQVNAYVDTLAGAELNYGDLLFVEGKPQETSAPANPGEFNFKGYLVYQNIHFQQFIGKTFAVIGHQTPNYFMRQALYFSGRCQRVFERYIPNERSRAIALALVLGVKDNLDDDTLRAYSATGAMHVLAVSGLHVGIIYMLLLWLIKRGGLGKRQFRWYVAIFSILILWCYALLTGLSPSVLRAVTMFSFFALSRAMFRRSNIYNTLAASALALLLYNPYLIMSVGFQLSYLAVLGIVYIQPKLYALWETKYWLFDKVWAITCVSISAQIATGPLSVLYFHQFPNYFLISNLFIIPSAFGILIAGLALLAFSFVPLLATGLGWLLSGFIWLVNVVVDWVSAWPGSLAEGLFTDILDTWALYALIITIALFFVRKKLYYLKVGVGFALLFCINQVNHKAAYWDSSEIAVMNISNTMAVDFRQGTQGKLIADSAFMADTERQRFHLYAKRLLADVSQAPATDVLDFPIAETVLGKLVTFNGKSVLFLASDNQVKLNEEIKIDFCIVSGDSSFELLSNPSFQPAKVIVAPTLSYYKTNQLKSLLEKRSTPCHIVRSDGYFEEVWFK